MSNKDSQKIQTNYEIIAIAVEPNWSVLGNDYSFCLEFSLDELRHVNHFYATSYRN